VRNIATSFLKKKKKWEFATAPFSLPDNGLCSGSAYEMTGPLEKRLEK